jgi:hypothetical protein
MKDRKQLLEEIMDDVAKNQLSREIELDLVEKYHMPKALKLKNKEERKVHIESLEHKKKELKDEMDAREYLIKSIKKQLK